jgi:hypothetical protein
MLMNSRPLSKIITDETLTPTLSQKERASEMDVLLPSPCGRGSLEERGEGLLKEVC